MKTKILATIGPASNKRDVLSKLIAAGVRIFRLNFSHGDSSSFVDLIKMIRELEIVHKTPITILQDLSGPKKMCIRDSPRRSQGWCSARPMYG